MRILYYCMEIHNFSKEHETVIGRFTGKVKAIASGEKTDTTVRKLRYKLPITHIYAKSCF